MERRLAAILAADVVGYSRLMGVDEEGVLAARLQLRLLRLDASGRPFHDYGAVRTRSKGKERLKRERAAPPSVVSAWLAMRRDQGAFSSAAAIMAEDRMP